jgi:short subunit dehydrogenase-like uncharacterized protein
MNPRIAVYGASGYTGKLVAAELVRRNIDLVLVGRDEKRLHEAANQAGAPDAETRVAPLDDQTALVDAFDNCAAVVNCVAPFTTYGEPVVRAAIAAGCHYVDISGERQYIARLFDRYTDEAERAGVTVVPMVNDGGFLADLVTSLAARGRGPIDTIRLDHRFSGDGGFSRGSARTALANLEQFQSDAALPELATIPRHVPTRRIEGGIDPELLAKLTPDILRRIEALPIDGPDEQTRRAVRFTLVADLLASDGRRTRGEVRGADTYGTTAVVAVEAAHRLATSSGAKPGVLAPAQAFDAGPFLDCLRPYGVSWTVQSS